MHEMDIEIHDSKTIISNMDEIMKSLDRPFEYIVEYMLIELGVQIIDDICTINGEHSREKLELLLDKFIEEYVLCPK